MPVIPTPEGWVRVAAPRRKPPPREHQADALKHGPLSYFACQPVPSRPTKPPPCPKYDLDDLPSPPKNPKRRNGEQGKRKKDRTVSAPVHDYSSEASYSDDEEPAALHHSSHHGHNQRHGHGHRSTSAAARPRPQHSPAPHHIQPGAPGYKYWTGPTQRKASAPPRSNYTSSSAGSSRSGASARWANATAPLDLG